MQERAQNVEEQLKVLVDDEVRLDLLLVCANKPVNYNNLKNFGCNDLWTVAKSFAVARNHSQQAITEAIMTLQDADGFSEKMPELISLSGIELQQKGISGAPLYYAREEYFQDLVYKLAEDRIKQAVIDTLGFPIEKARQRECQIARIFLQYLNDAQFYGPPLVSIPIEIEKFKHYYGSMFGKEIPAEITTSLIIDVLQRARLGYEYDGRFYPFWYTYKKYTGLMFRKMLDENIAARIA